MLAPGGAGECFDSSGNKQGSKSVDTQRDCAKTAPAGTPGSGQADSHTGEGLMGLKTQEEPAAPTAGKAVVKIPVYPSDFEACYELYPRQQEKQAAFKAWKARLSEGNSASALIICTRHYAESCRINNTEEGYVKMAKTFYGPSKPFLEYLDGPIIERKGKPHNGPANSSTPIGKTQVDTQVNWDKFYQ